MAKKFSGRHGTFKLGQKVTFKLDCEGRGTIVEIKERQSFMGTRIEVIIAIAGHSHFGFERWDSAHDSYVVMCDTDQVF